MRSSSRNSVSVSCCSCSRRQLALTAHLRRSSNSVSYVMYFCRSGRRPPCLLTQPLGSSQRNTWRRTACDDALAIAIYLPAIRPHTAPIRVGQRSGRALKRPELVRVDPSTGCAVHAAEGRGRCKVEDRSAEYLVFRVRGAAGMQRREFIFFSSWPHCFAGNLALTEHD